MGGLIGIATANKDGLKPKNEVSILNINIATTLSGKYTKITCSDTNSTIIWKRTQYNGAPEIIFISRGNKNDRASNIGAVTRINKNLEAPKIYVDTQGALYLQVIYSDYPKNCIFNLLGSSALINEGDVELPSDAVELAVRDIVWW